MKVVLFCGGLGTRLREYTDNIRNIPKPLIPIGQQPILWYLMKYYAHFGHKDFILCLGHMGEKIKEFFLKYSEYIGNDFTMLDGGRKLQLARSDIHDWRITFVDTGLKSNIGERLRRVKPYLEGEEVFLANYSDGLTDMPLNEMIDHFIASGKTGGFVCARPSQSFHVVALDAGSNVKRITTVKDAGIRVNGGFFVFRKEIFEYIEEGEELVVEPFSRLIEKELLLGYKYDRFWCMDTFKEQQELTDMLSQGMAPWEVWRETQFERPNLGGQLPRVGVGMLDRL